MRAIPFLLLMLTLSGCAARLHDLTDVERSRLRGSWAEFLAHCGHRDRFRNTDGDERVIYWCDDLFVFVDPKTGNIETHERHR